MRDLWCQIRSLQARLEAGDTAPDEPAPPLDRYRDPTLAAVAALVATAAVLATAVSWIATGWPQGVQAVMFAGVITSILASLDEPATAATNFLKMTTYSAVIAAVYVFGVLLRIEGFATLVAVLMPFYLPFGALLALPQVGPTVLPLVLNTTALLGLANERTPPDLAGYLNA